MSTTYQEKECEVCGVWFTPTRANAKYCPACRKHAVQKLRKIEYQTQRNIRTYGYGCKPEQITCKCGYCEKDFVTYGKEKDFCSASCASKYRIAHTVCAYCGKPMTETEDIRDVMGKNWYCSDGCQENAAWRYARVEGKVKTCPNCGKEFIKDNTYCSRNCYMEYTRKQKEKSLALKASGLKECSVCGKKFSGNGMYCSPECQKKQEMQEPHAMRTCEVCGKEFDCSASRMVHPICSDACLQLFEEKKAEMKKNRKSASSEKLKEKKLKKQQKYIEENGLCSICKTSHKDCERLQSNFAASPEGSVFQGSLVVKCPKFRK